MAKIRIEHLIKLYGSHPRTALSLFRKGANKNEILEKTGQVLGIADVSVEINPGEIFVVMGLSGSGKSTLVRCLNRLIKPTSGHIYIDGEDVVRFNAQQIRHLRSQKVSMVFQSFGLFPHKTVIENVEYGLKIRGVSKPERRQKALETLATVGLSQWKSYAPASLSGGMQQRVGLARALATDAGILLMDEPFSALDPLTRRDMQDELLRLQKGLSKTIIFISHDIQEALRIGDRIAIMKDGQIVQVNTPEKLITQPANEYVRNFIQDVNRAQVLRVRTLSHPAHFCRVSQDSAESIYKQMQIQRQQHMYVVNHNTQPIGFLERHQLETAIQQGNFEITEIMDTHFSKVQENNSLESICHLYQTRIPLAVVNEFDQLSGIIEFSDILAHIGGFSKPIENTNQDNAVSGLG
ncbi:MAG: glycine betaine/L-proline ABC transporter ATP-binding protein [Cyanobacteria bacterium P01_G01_bin.54]